MKRIITAGLTLAMLAAMTQSAASEAGTASDPLITRSYAEGEYAAGVVASLTGAIDETLGGVYAAAAAKVSPAEDGRAWSNDREMFIAIEGSGFTVLEGGCLTLLEGSMTVNVTSGKVIDTSRGSAVVSGSKLQTGRRYICAEDTEARYSGSGKLILDGAYMPAEGLFPAGGIYSDVKSADWFMPSAAYAKAKGLFPDSGGELFAPNEPVTRAEMVYALWRDAGSPAPGGAAEYTDLTESWYMDAVAWATEREIANGRENGRFDPDGGLDRQQLATFLFRYVKATGGRTSARAGLSGYTDQGEISDWARDAFSWAVAAGVINGTGKDTLSPLTPAVRSQVATVLMRLAG